MEIYGNMWKYVEYIWKHGNICIYICMEMYVNIWKYMDNVSFLDRKMERWWWIHLNFLLSTRTYV